MRKRLASTSLVSLCFAASSSAVTVFSHNFENGMAGDLSGSGDLGTPSVGTIAATGGHVSSTRPGYTTGNNGSSNAITTVANGSFNDTGTAAGNYLTATLSTPAAVVGGLGAGQTTTISFTTASYGTSNQNAFKLFHAIGLSSTGDEVFQITWRAGSAGATRELFARELGEDDSTFSGGTLSSIEGTKILDDVSFGINSTNTTMQPSGVISVSITIGETEWGASGSASGGSSTSTPASGLGMASGATDLAEILFFSSHNSTVSTQNKGGWVDNIVVETDLLVPEPGVGVLALLGFGGLVARRRRS